MNTNLSGPKIPAIGGGSGRWAAGWLALFLAAGVLGRAMAQTSPAPAPPLLMPPAAPTVVTTPRASAGPSERWLFIFDTSSAMKKRLPALDAEIRLLFGTNLGERLHTGDSIGVWTFDTQVHAGQYPLMTWQPEHAATMATNLMKFVRSQDFSGKTDFSVLKSLVERVIGTSERLTIVIFCDGEGRIHLTPYDDGINQNMVLGTAERKKSRQPLVIVVRSQQGVISGATVNYPPADVTVPPFPPLPVVVKAVPALVHIAPPPPPHLVVELPPLIIVGKTEGTDVMATARFEATNTVARPAPVHTNPVMTSVAPPSVPPVTAPVTEPVTAPVLPEVTAIPESSPNPNPEKNPVANEVTSTPISHNAAPTNAVVVAGTADTGLDRGTKILLAMGAGFLVTAVVLVVWLATRRRRPTASLITSLMSEDPRFRK
jgi:hypothetical protein